MGNVGHMLRTLAHRRVNNGHSQHVGPALGRLANLRWATIDSLQLANITDCAGQLLVQQSHAIWVVVCYFHC